MDTETLFKVEFASGRNDKEAILRTLGEDTKRFIKLAVDPFITFGVTVKPEDQMASWMEAQMSGCNYVRGNWWDAFEELCQKLASRVSTGNEAKMDIANVLACAPHVQAITWACRVLNKDLRAGFNISTVQKLWPDLVQPFAVQLAHPYNPEKHSLADSSWELEPKLDGLRVTVVDGTAYTRNGKMLTSVDHILEELREMVSRYGPLINVQRLEELVFDGECMGAEFNEGSGKARGSEAAEDLLYHVFDCVKRPEWIARQTSAYWIRRSNLDQLLNEYSEFHSLRAVPHTTLPPNPTAEEVFAARDNFIEQGFEGGMLKDRNMPYQFKRTAALLKLKNFTSADGLIKGTEEGKGKHKGRLGALLVEFDGVLTHVGSGFSDDQRQEMWDKRDWMFGKWVEVQYQNLTPDGKLRFPVFIKMRPDLA